LKETGGIGSEPKPELLMMGIGTYIYSESCSASAIDNRHLYITTDTMNRGFQTMKILQPQHLGVGKIGQN
jgi:hypothetical protein